MTSSHPPDDRLLPLDPGVTADIALVLLVVLFATTLLRLAHAYLVERQRHATIRAFLAAGQVVPPALLVPPRPRSDLARGLVLIAAGVGTTAFLLLGEHADVWSVGLVPGILGLGYVAAWWLARERPPAEDNPPRT